LTAKTTVHTAPGIEGFLRCGGSITRLAMLLLPCSRSRGGGWVPVGGGRGGGGDAAWQVVVHGIYTLESVLNTEMQPEGVVGKPEQTHKHQVLCQSSSYQRNPSYIGFSSIGKTPKSLSSRHVHLTRMFFMSNHLSALSSNNYFLQSACRAITILHYSFGAKYAKYGKYVQHVKYDYLAFPPVHSL
jgi:hypothetical protein